MVEARPTEVTAAAEEAGASTAGRSPGVLGGRGSRAVAAGPRPGSRGRSHSRPQPRWPPRTRPPCALARAPVS